MTVPFGMVTIRTGVVLQSAPILYTPKPADKSLAATVSGVFVLLYNSTKSSPKPPGPLVRISDMRKLPALGTDGKNRCQGFFFSPSPSPEAKPGDTSGAV